MPSLSRSARTNTDQDMGKKALGFWKEQITYSVGEEAGATEVFGSCVAIGRCAVQYAFCKRVVAAVERADASKREGKGGKHDRPGRGRGVEGRRDRPMHREPGQIKRCPPQPPPSQLLTGAGVSDKPDRQPKDNFGLFSESFSWTFLGRVMNDRHSLRL